MKIESRRQRSRDLWNIHSRHEKSQLLKVIMRTLPRVSRKSGAVLPEKRHRDYFLITYPL